MNIVKSLSVGEGDMFYIKHGSDNFTIIDCCMDESTQESIISELKREKAGKTITRFISTHPDDDHIRGIEYLSTQLDLLNFYCVENSATKPDESSDFDYYCKLRNSEKAFHIFAGCKRKWMNEKSDERGSSGINILWPNTQNYHFKSALKDAQDGKSPNNISPIIKYNLENGATLFWMGDLETEFMQNIEKSIEMPKIDILFAPHHGRDSGKVPQTWLDKLKPKIVIIGEAPSKDLNYYTGYNTITQNSAGDITFDCVESFVHIYVSSKSYSVNFLTDKGLSNTYDRYIGTLEL